MSTKTTYFVLEGGLDQSSSVYVVPSGAAIEAENFEVSPGGGYARIAGFDRYDGRPEPHKATGTAGTTAAEFAAAKLAAALVRRNAIQAVPGSGPVRGVVEFAGTVYAFRDSADGTSCRMYRASPAGWQLVNTPALQPGGQYRFSIWNFGGATGLRRLYGCDGKNKAFEFDGTTMTPIATGMAQDAPCHVVAHKNHLFLSFGSSLQHSAIANPLSWDPVLGAAEIAMGDDITNLMVAPGGASNAALMVTTKESVKVLYGNSAADWNLVTLSNETGAYAGSLVAVGSAFALSRRGVAGIAPDNTFANFNVTTLSQRIPKYIERFAPALRGTTVSYSRNQFVFHFGSGMALAATIGGQGLLGFMPLNFGRAFTAFWSASKEDGEDLILAGGEDGFVYRLNVGTNFDGHAIPARLWLAYAHFKAPRSRKRFRKAVLELTAEGYGTFASSALYDFANPAVQPFTSYTPEEVSGFDEGGISLSPSYQLWDATTWDQFFFDGRPVAPVEVKMEGSGETVSLMFASNSALCERFALHGVILHYDVRRPSR